MRRKLMRGLIRALFFFGCEFCRWGPVEDELACIKKHLDQQSISIIPMPQVMLLRNNKPENEMLRITLSRENNLF